MRKITLPAAVAVAAVLTGCGMFPEPVTSGTVVEKEYEEAYTETGYRQECYGSSKDGTKYCFDVPDDTYHPECYEFDLKAEDGRMGEVCVTAEEYERYEVGEQYP